MKPKKTSEADLENKRRYYLENKERIKAATLARYWADPGAAREYKRTRRQDPEVKAREREATAQWVKDNPTWVKNYFSEYRKKRRLNDPVFLAALRVRCRFSEFITKRETSEKGGACLDLVGCTRAQLSRIIESMFQPGMTWDNRSEWHVDHVVPCSAFDLRDVEQQKKCFHYSNLRVLWAEDNMRKGANAA